MASALRRALISQFIYGYNNCGFNYSVRTIVLPRTKPRHLPMAKTKLFRIPVHPYFPPDEVKLIEDLLSEYKRRIASLGHMFHKEHEKTSDTSAFAAAEAAAAEEEHQQLMEFNRLENERVRLIREETLECELQEKIAKLMKQYEEMESEREEKKITVLQAIEQVKEESVTYITLETLEQAIEYALDNPVNYNFCIDLNGNKYREDDDRHLGEPEEKESVAP